MAGQGTAPARAALVGNPSDGFGGRVVALAVPHFGASVEALDHEAAPLPADLGRLVEAAAAAFGRHADRVGRTLGPGPTGWRCRSTVPRRSGLGGSSAVIVAALRALSAHHGLPIERPLLASIALSAEIDVLGVPAGLQDAVAQAYGTLVDVDVGPDVRTERDGWTMGRYTVLDQTALPPLWLAWRSGGAESTTDHGELRRRFDAGEPRIVAAVDELRRLAARAAGAIADGDGAAIGPLMDATVDVRRTIVELPPDQAALVDAARSITGVHANVAGPRGAVVGTAPPDGIDRLEAALTDLGATWLVLAATRT